MRHNRKFLLLRYEDMLENPQRELSKVAAFLNLEASPTRLARAVELSSADHMRKMEKSQAKDWQLKKSTRQDKPFVRDDKAGGWRYALPGDAVVEIESSWELIIKSHGYE